MEIGGEIRWPSTMRVEVVFHKLPKGWGLASNIAKIGYKWRKFNQVQPIWNRVLVVVADDHSGCYFTAETALRLARAAAMARSMSSSVCAAETKRASNWEGGKKNAAGEHLAEECGEADRVRLLGVRIVADRSAAEEKREQRAGAVDLAGHARFVEGAAETSCETRSLLVERGVKAGRLRASEAWQGRRASPADFRRACQPDRRGRAGRSCP